MLECPQYQRERGELKPFTLVLAGGGSKSEVALTRDSVETLGLSACVRIEANHGFQRKRELYGAADIFVSLIDNYQETFGLTVIEAMAHGLPAISCVRVRHAEDALFRLTRKVVCRGAGIRCFNLGGWRRCL